jgi:hypothetical protein
MMKIAPLGFRNSFAIASLSIALSFSVPAKAQIAFSAPQVKVERVGAFIYYRTSFSQFSKEDQRTVIDVSVEEMKNELSQNFGKVPGLRTLSGAMLSDEALDAIKEQADRSVRRADVNSLRGLLPTALLFYGGVNGGVGIGASSGFSGDLGLVIFPEKVTEVDTKTGTSRSYIKIDFAWVVVPHLHFGVGVGGGTSLVVGAAVIFGGMTQASDFHGMKLSLSGDIQFIGGADASVSVVHNLSTSQNFLVAAGEFDWGPEAGASFDVETGYVYSLTEVGELFEKKIHSGRAVEVPDK